MNVRTAKTTGLLVFLPAVLAAAGLLAVNLYVQSPSVQGRICAAMEEALGVPVKIEKSGFTPWNGLRLRGVRARSASGETPLFRIDAVRVRAKLSSLLSSDIEIREITIETPVVTLRRSARGGIELPAPTHAAPDTAPAVPTPHAPPPHGAEPADPGTSAASPRPPRKVTVKLVGVRDGAFQFLDEKGRIVLDLQGITLRADGLGSDPVTGTLTIAKGLVRRAVAFEEIAGPFQIGGKKLTLPQISGTIAGGKIEGSVETKLASGATPFELKIHFADAALARLVEFAGGDPGRYSGRTSGYLALRGEVGNPESLTGDGSIRLDGGEMRQVDLLQTIGQALKIQEFSHLKLDDAHAAYRVRRGQIRIDELVLRSPNLRIEAKGSIKEKGKLDLEARLFMSRAIERQLPDLAKSNLVRIDAETHALDFKISGTLEDPETNLLERFIGGKLQQEVGRVLDGLFKRGKKEEPKIGGGSAQP